MGKKNRDAEIHDRDSRLTEYKSKKKIKQERLLQEARDSQRKISEAKVVKDEKRIAKEAEKDRIRVAANQLLEQFGPALHRWPDDLDCDLGRKRINSISQRHVKIDCGNTMITPQEICELL